MGAAVSVLLALIARCILRLEMKMKGPKVDPLYEAEDDEELFQNEIVIEFEKDDKG